MKNYITRLNAWKNTQELALMNEELIVDLRKIDIEEGKPVHAALAAAEARVSARKAGIEGIKNQIKEAKAKLLATF